MAAKLSDIGKIIQQAITSKPVLEAAAKVAVESVPLRTRLGKGVLEAEGETHSLPILKDKTKSNRRYLKEKGKLTGPGATPAKSGLNATGKLLSNMKYNLKPKGFEIKLQDKKQEEKAEYLLEHNTRFRFMNLSRAETNRMIKVMSTKINEILNKIKFDKF